MHVETTARRDGSVDGGEERGVSGSHGTRPEVRPMAKQHVAHENLGKTATHTVLCSVAFRVQKAGIQDGLCCGEKRFLERGRQGGTVAMES